MSDDLMEMVKHITRYIHNHRGEMPTEDLLDDVMWKLEALTGIEPDDA
jgi:chromatin remodeling complex protein RSC6